MIHDEENLTPHNVELFFFEFKQAETVSYIHDPFIDRDRHSDLVYKPPNTKWSDI